MPEKLDTGLPGLNHITHGGLISERAYLVQGGPGSGKSILCYHILHAAIQKDEPVLIITFGESEEQIIYNAKSAGIDLTSAHILNLSPNGGTFLKGERSDILDPGEYEREYFAQKIITILDRVKPTRVLLDSITVLGMMNDNIYQFRSLALSLIKFITKRKATLFITSESWKPSEQEEAAYWADGIIKLSADGNWPQIKITKYRGSNFQKELHSYRISDNGFTVFPKLHPSEYYRNFEDELFSSGITSLDKLLHGGIEKGTTTLITGPTGVGKTNLGIQFLQEAASRNQRSVIYTFEESRELITRRSKGINVPVDKMLENENLHIAPIEPLSFSPDEFSALVQTDIEEKNTRFVIIDTVNAYSLSVGDDNPLERLHSLMVYLQNMGVTSILINESSQITGFAETTSLNASYLADNVIFLQYIEMESKLQKAIGVLKKRLSDFEKSIRAFSVTSEGIKVGEPLYNYTGIMSGTATPK